MDKPEVIAFLEKTGIGAFKDVGGVWTSRKFYLAKLLQKMGKNLRPSINVKTPPNAMTFLWKGKQPITLLFVNKPYPAVEVYPGTIDEPETNEVLSAVRRLKATARSVEAATKVTLTEAIAGLKAAGKNPTKAPAWAKSLASSAAQVLAILVYIDGNAQPVDTYGDELDPGDLDVYFDGASVNVDIAGADEASSLAQRLKRFNRDGIKVAARRALVTINFK